MNRPAARNFGMSQTAPRREDARFLTGAGRYVDDIAPPDALHAVVVRSPMAHAAITGLDADAAREMPGVHLVLTAQDLAEAGLAPSMDFTTVGEAPARPDRPILARDRVRHVGEAVAFVVAETRQEARDAAEAVEVGYDDLPAKLDLAPGGPVLHEEAPDNIAFDWSIGDNEATEAAFAAAAHRIRLEVPDHRVIANPMEPRGGFAEWQDGRLHLCVNGQGVWDLKSEIIRVLGLPEEGVRVTNPDVGGGFGMKGSTYPEHYLLAEAARRLGRPVRWMSERTEGMLSDNAGRDLVTVAELAVDADHRILAYRIDSFASMGAYNGEYGQPIQSDLFSRVLTGVYAIPAAFMRTRGVYTSTTPTDAYRGAGRPEAIYVLERLIDRAAREIGADPWEFRRRNAIAPEAMPYCTPSGQSYDCGDFPGLIEAGRAKADLPGFAARKAGSEARGMLRGMGICAYIESILGNPSESAAVEFDADGGATLFVGTQSNGQGHETVYAELLAAQSGLDPARIRVVQGDSDRIRQGGGTGGSRSVTVQGTAIAETVVRIVAAYTPFVAAEMGQPEAEVSFEDGAFRAAGTNRVMSLAEAAAAARAAGRDDLLRIEARIRLKARSFPNGLHVAEVEIDPETGMVRLDRYAVVDDFGTLMHPQLVEGQVHGGIAQGAGQVLMERAVHDETGQLLTATFMDYAMPRATDFPLMHFTSRPVPTAMNPLGMKGCGEAGTVGSMAAVANAVQDALWPLGVRQADMPFTPLRVWEMVRAAAG